MEAVPRLPMLGFKLKQTAEPHTSFNNLKLYIAELYQEDADSYSKEVHELETLRNVASRPSHDQDGCLKLKRYYCQLNSLLHRFPLLAERPLLSFTWRDAHSSTVVGVSDLRWEMAVILYNIAALHAQLGSEEQRTTPESMKLACTHFQCAVGALDMFKERGAAPEMADLSSDVIMFMDRVCLAQAQECILEKSLADSRKPGIVAKVTSQIVNYYNSALAIIIASGEDGLLADTVGSRQYKDWKKYLMFKISYLSSILYLYQGQSAEEGKKFGERVTLCQLAFDKFEEAKKEAKGMIAFDQVQKTLNFTAEIVEAKRKAAKNENEFIYHEEVPDISTISAVQGAGLVNGIPFSVTDAELLGTDIFHRLVPMKAHEGSSLYSEEKAQLLRSIGTKIEDRDAELNGFMNSLNMEFLQFDNATATKLPQAIVDRCASLNARPNAIPDLVALMSQLAENCGEVEMLLREIKHIFAEEEVQERAYQQAMGQRPTVHLSELNREYQKYQEAHNKAGESNETLRKAMGLHVANLRTLSKPMTEIQQLVPQMSNKVGGANSDGNNDNPHFAELRKLLNKVTEMRGQRTQFVNSLREAINSDDITSKIVAWGDNELQELFKQEMAKHEKTATLIDMNLVAQGNILKALTDCYARCASAIKQMSDTKHKRDQFFSALVASYDVYEDLLGKSTKGLEFYKKLHNNVAKLMARVKAARDVQMEERQQRLNSTAKGGGSSGQQQDKPATTNSGPKLRDYMKAGGYVPAVRPSPLGSENTTAPTCVTATSTDKFNSQTMVVGTMQYSNTGADNNAVSGGNNFNQQNYVPAASDGNYYATNTPAAASTTGTNYRTNYPSSQPSQVATGYVNPIYQTGGGYGRIGEQQSAPSSASSYNYPTTSSPASSVVSNASNPQGSTNYSAGYNNQQQQYLPNPSTPSTAQSYNSAAMPSNSTSNYSGSYSSSTGQGYSQNYAETNAAYPTSNSIPTTATMTATSLPNVSNYSSVPSSYGQTYSSGMNNNSYGTQSSNATTVSQQQQPYGQYSGYSNQPQQQITATGGNQYATSGTSNIPQVSQQMSQMNITNQQQQGTTTTGSTGDYYGTQSQYSTGTNQTYYGQSPAGNTMQYQQQQQYGIPTSDGGQYSSVAGTQQNPQSLVAGNSSQQVAQSQYNNQQGYGYNNQYSATTNWTAPGGQQQQQQPQQQEQYNIPVQQGYGANYSTPTGAYNTAGGVSTSGYNVTQQNATPTVTQANPQNSPVYSNPPAESSQATYVTPQPQARVTSTPQPPAAAVPTPVVTTQVDNAPINSRNMDLLSGIDFAGPVVSLPEPMLQPKPAGSVSAGNSVVGVKEPEKEKSIIDDEVVSVLMDDSQPPPTLAKMDHIKSFLMSAQQQQQPSQSSSPSLSAGMPMMDRKLSMDNISVCSEISSIDQNFDWESVSVRNDSVVGGEQNEAIMSKFRTDGGADDPKAIKWFHSEVERLEKFLEGVNIKTLNGSTPLDKKWQELQNLLAKDAGKRQTSVAKLFPEKNRSPDCIPFDHARVQLPTATDDYVNASYVKFNKDKGKHAGELGSGCPTLILAQTPMQATNKDFWHMVWSQKSRLVMCLHTPAEMMHPFWPTKVNEELQFDDFSIVLLKQFDLTNCIEYNLKLTMLGSDVVHELSALQLKTWAQNVPSQVVGVARDVITSYKQRVMSESGGGGGVSASSPIVINCLTGSRRSPLVAVTIVAVLATRSKRPLLINVVDAWYRIAAQRRGVLENEKELEYSFQVVLSNAHDLLNKHGIMTPYQVKNAQKAAIIEKEQIKDPLSELDPLWKMKK